MLGDVKDCFGPTRTAVFVNLYFIMYVCVYITALETAGEKERNRVHGVREGAHVLCVYNCVCVHEKK